MARLDEYINQIIVHTGQNYDYELNEVFFNDLNIRKPDYFLNVDTSSLGATVGDIIRKTEEVLKKEKPDALLVLGDTNSSLSAYIARRMHITIFHMEAGNRCFDFNVPEEINRRIIDHISDYNLVYAEHARRHLIAEGLPQRRIYLTGSPLNEVLRFYDDKINNSVILDKLKLEKKKYFVVSTHREENVDNLENLAKILAALNQIAKEYNYPVIVSTHPRTMKRLKEHLNSDKLNSLINFLKPFGFFDYVALQKNAACVLSDSGTISEESAMLSFPAISLRTSMERPEAQDTGTIILSGLDSDIILSSIEAVIDEHSQGSYKEIPADYKIENTSWRVVKLILGNTRLSNKWDAINIC
jgi:UDP-N-acetylglucosamine 2-epimerase (non-hydrolysing)